MGDKRKHPRYKLKQAITAAVRTEKRQRVAIFSVLNISREGMLIAGEIDIGDFTDNETVHVALYASQPRQLVAECVAQIVDFRGEGRFGVNIRKMAAQDQDYMMNVCANLAEEEE